MNMLKSKKSLAIFGIIVIVVIVIAAIAAILHPKEGSPAPSGQAVQAAAQAIIQSGDVSQCASVNAVVDGANYETVCKNNIAWNDAVTNLDINACNGLDNRLMSIANCQNAVIAGLINKDKTLATCDQFTGTLKDSCVTAYWVSVATSGQDPSLCGNIVSSSSRASLDCEYDVLISSVSNGTSTPSCSLFAGIVKTDCANIAKGACAAIRNVTFQQICRTRIR